ncbi:hypothetical protein ID866_5953 [Astraeus odoratus]|nr:hypothetical protein ID866_5953 [Astraeus odoratus]
MATSLILQGRGISWAEGQAHKRQRKILNPGFNTQESRALFSVSSASADALCDKWMGLVMSNHNRQVVVDVPTWISRAALDVITEGKSAFGIRLNCLQDPESTLARVFDSMLLDVFGTPSVAQIFMEESLQYIPEEILEYCSKHSSNPRLRRIRENKEVTAAIAKDLMKEKADSLLEERGAQDILTLLVKTNMDAEAKHKMSDEELYAQMRYE